MGQAAGTAAAMMACGQVAIDGVVGPLQQALRHDGVELGFGA